MTVQASSSFLAVLSAAVLLLASGDTAPAAKKNSAPPVHGTGSSHNPIVYHPVHGSGSTHNPIVYRPKPHPCAGPGTLRPGDCNPPKPPCRVGPHGECIPNY
jgi:hypothetical protein